MSDSEKNSSYMGDMANTYSTDAGKGDKYRTVNKRRYDSNYEKIKWSSWYVYILECGDKTLYCGITNDLNKRIEDHNKGKGAKYTAGRTPVVLMYKEKCRTKSDALKREIQIKKMRKAEKLCLINGYRDREGSSTDRATD